MKYKVALIGGNWDTYSWINTYSDKLDICFSKLEETIVSINGMTIPVNNDLHNMMLERERHKEEILYSYCVKDCYDLMIANIPDIVMLDFSMDILYGVLEINSETYIPNNINVYNDNLIAKRFNITNKYGIDYDFNLYFQLWKKSFDQFMNVIKMHLPDSVVAINRCRVDSKFSGIQSYMQKLIDYAHDNYECFICEENRENVVIKQKKTHAETAKRYNLILNSDWRSNTLFWKKWDESYSASNGKLAFCDISSNVDIWHLLLSNDIEVPSNELCHLSFECKVKDKAIMKDKRIFTIRSFDTKNVIMLNEARDNIAIYYEEDEGFHRYDILFIPRGKFVSVGPEVRQRGIIEYRNIMLTIGEKKHTGWNTSYLEEKLQEKNIELVDVNLDYSLYKQYDNLYEGEFKTIELTKRDNTVHCVDTEQCYSCGACCNICPKDAIDMKSKKWGGTLFPEINKEKCISCGLCVKACPALNRYSGKIVNPRAYAVKNDEKVAEESSSAGVFYNLAKYVYEHGGYVCGAVWDNSFNAVHILTNDWNQIEKMRRSKYVQSDIGMVYREILELLKADKLVLFTGTPCQIAGLYGFLGKKYDKLLTVDLICHGTPMPGIWKQYLNENWDIDELENIDFRYRGNKGHWGSQFLKFTYKNGNEIIFDNVNNCYYKAFKKKYILKDSCMDCKYAVTPRVGDFSIGDWWGAVNVRPDLIDGNKMSIVLLNSKKSISIFNEIREKFQMTQEISYSQAMNNNRASAKIDRPKERDLIEKDIEEGKKFEQAVRNTLFPQYDIIIVGSTLNPNYGAIMTYYALYKVCKLFGYNVGVANYQSKNTPKHSLKFFEQYTQLAPSENNYRQYNWMTDTFLLGSDQLWNYNCFENCKLSFYLDFADSSKKKISYATSFGFDYLTMYEKKSSQYPKANSLIKRFDDISIRESDGVKVCKQEYSLSASRVLDPVFLITEDIYSEIAKNAANKPTYRYITSYFLSAQEQFNKLLRLTSKELHLPMVNMLTGNQNAFPKQKEKSLGLVCDNLTMEEWVYNIKNSEFVVTDSFHCTCFSIIFRKKFIVIQKGWGLSRLTSLLTMLGLEDRLIGSYDEIKDKMYLFSQEIDYDEVYKILDSKRRESLQWLSDSLKKPRKVSEHYYIKNNNIFKTKHTISEMVKEYNNVSNDYVLLLCTKGYGFSREKLSYIAEQFSIDVSGETKIDSILKSVSPIVAEGNGCSNHCISAAEFKEKDLEEYLRMPHQVYSITFDWKADATKGSFYIQLEGAPWDCFTDSIIISNECNHGHYENICISSSGVEKFAGKGIQIRTDNMDGCVEITNLVINRGNRPAKVSPDGIMHGFAAICDKQTDYIDISLSSINRLEYNIAGTRLLLEYSNEGYRDCEPISELYVEDGIHRDIYPLKKEGIYIMMYSKNKREITSVAYVNNELHDETVINW